MVQSKQNINRNKNNRAWLQVRCDAHPCVVSKHSAIAMHKYCEQTQVKLYVTYRRVVTGSRNGNLSTGPTGCMIRVLLHHAKPCCLVSSPNQDDWASHEQLPRPGRGRHEKKKESFGHGSRVEVVSADTGRPNVSLYIITSESNDKKKMSFDFSCCLEREGLLFSVILH